MKTYEERLNDLAAEFARAEWRMINPNIRFAWDTDYLSKQDKKQRIDNMLPLARIALKHMAEAYTEGCETILLDKDEIQRNLFITGLIEPQTT